MSSVSKTAAHAVDHAKNAKRATRASLIELGSQALRLVNDIRERDSSGASWPHIGRRRAPGSLSPAVWFAAGATLAGGAFLLLAPRGADLRSRLASLAARVKEMHPGDDKAADDMANEGGGSRPRATEDPVAAH